MPACLDLQQGSAIKFGPGPNFCLIMASRAMAKTCVHPACSLNLLSIVRGTHDTCFP